VFIGIAGYEASFWIACHRDGIAALTLAMTEK
jgi:hypothetical protein